ncbi:MAG: metallophosphoesterase [Actinobacteria bacterium]|nr:metallophosphoesterase [Actinomycetota bacterium]MCB9411411.1 metallophosphoesterase [Actinomycetota bacterium]
MIGATAALAATGGAALLGYSLWEAGQYTLRQVSVPALPAGTSEPLRVLHLSDLHLTGAHADRAEWVRQLATTTPDLVIATGDFLSAADGLPLVQQALAGFAGVPGAFVFGSNDYFAARRVNPTGYLRGPSKHTRRRRPDLPTEELRGYLAGLGWLDLNNSSGELTTAGARLALRGVDDPHIRRDRYRVVGGDWPEADLRVGVTHAPYLRVLDALDDDDADLIFAGHTHGGQICLPGFGALVTNCDLDRSQASGLSRHGDAWLHVSAGLGTNPNTPIRLACRPTATVLTLTVRSG